MGNNPERSCPQGKTTGNKEVLSVESLSVRFSQGEGVLSAVSEVSFSMDRTESVAMVGESGSGKTTVLRAIAGILAGQAQISGSITFGDQQLDKGHPMTPTEKIGFIFQDPVNCFNPSMTVGSQLRRVLKIHRPDIIKEHRDGEILDFLERVGINGRGKLKNYPFEFSQGQLQRIMIAIVCLGIRPTILLADEPTTSLDVTTEAHVLELLREMRAEFGMALLLVSHNLAVAAQLCDRALVMYGGRMVEEAAIIDLFDHPSHPYTRQLLKSLPRFPHGQGRLHAIPGEPVGAWIRQKGCAFQPRCAEVIGDVCTTVVPDLVPTGQARQRAACHLYQQWLPDYGGQRKGRGDSVEKGGNKVKSISNKASRAPEHLQRTSDQTERP